MLKIAWESPDAVIRSKRLFLIMKDLSYRYDPDIKVYISKNGELVMKWYNLWHGLKEIFPKVSFEHS